jgi:hypothetical protein
MGTMNKKKYIALGVISSVLTITAIAFQNFTGSEATKVQDKSSKSLTDALSAALKSAEADTTEKQIALNVEPSQIEQSAFKKRKKPDVIMGSDEALTETNVNWVPKEQVPTQEIEDSVAPEINDTPAE